MIAATEIGSIMEPAQLKAYQADWLYFCVWSGDYISAGVWNPLDLIKRVYADEYVLNLDDIQDWKSP
jgi:mannan endo-1,4-beta-mannosidase